MLNENQIKELRVYLKKNKLTHEDFSKILGVHRNTITRYLNQKGTPSSSVRRFIFKLTGIDL